MHMPKSKIVVLVVVGLIVIAGLYFGLFAKEPSEYSVVYLSTGDLYVGKLSSFPRLKLTDGYIFQVARDATNPERNNFQLAPLKETLWAPKYLYLNQEQIIFSGPLSEASNIFATLTQNAAGGTVAPAPAGAGAPTTNSTPDPAPERDE